ncbi:MAG: TetR/AcrR family transcriptional regulator, partial [Clostridia bacterium]|nr:TetR/AcrR family transcriptional regulator [Clostridia bacterium]
LIVEKLLERDDCTREDAEYIAWMSLLMADGLIVHSQLGNPAFDPQQFIRKTEEFFKDKI